MVKPHSSFASSGKYTLKLLIKIVIIIAALSQAIIITVTVTTIAAISLALYIPTLGWSIEIVDKVSCKMFKWMEWMD